MTRILAIDAGQSTMKVRLVDASGSHDASVPGIRTDAPLLPQLAAVARAHLRPEDGPVSLAAGVSGLTAGDDDPAALRALVGDEAVDRVMLAHDSVTSYLGAVGDARGAVTAVGTGVVTLAVGADAVARVDGWGYLMGDAGSGFWIGRAALEAVLRAHDGRGAATSLTDAVRERWPDLGQAYIGLQADPARVSVVASYARTVAEHAEAGDGVAAGILDAAAAELAHSVATGMRRVGVAHDPDAAVCAIGGVFRSGLLTTAFAAALAAEGVRSRPRDRRGEGVDGVVALAGLTPGHPLRASVSSAP